MGQQQRQGGGRAQDSGQNSAGHGLPAGPEVPEGVENHGNAEEVVGGVFQPAGEPAGANFPPPQLKDNGVPKPEEHGGQKQKKYRVQHIGPERQCPFDGLRTL